MARWTTELGEGVVAKPVQVDDSTTIQGSTVKSLKFKPRCPACILLGRVRYKNSSDPATLRMAWHAMRLLERWAVCGFATAMDQNDVQIVFGTPSASSKGTAV